MSDTDQLHQIGIDVAVLKHQVSSLITSNATQERILRDLEAKKNQGKGMAWALIGLGTLAGSILTNWKSILMWLGK